jgi:hypothetical protein
MPRQPINHEIKPLNQPIANAPLISTPGETHEVIMHTEAVRSDTSEIAALRKRLAELGDVPVHDQTVVDIPAGKTVTISAPVSSVKTMSDLLAEDREKQRLRMEEKVMIHLFKDNNTYSQDLSVQVNGKTWLIQRGKDIMVPRSVAEVLTGSQHQDMLAMEMAQRAANVDLGER